jgi:TRAP-type C4-dicarboxylate transport system permease small subunit
MKPLRRFLEAALGLFSVFLIVALTVLVLVAVVYRELGLSLPWYDEVATVMLAWLTYFGSAYAALKRGHLGSPEFLMRLSTAVRLPLFVLGEVLVIGFFALLAWVGLEVVILLAGDTLVSLPWVPVQLTQAVIPVGALLFILCQLATIPDEWENLKRLDDPAMIRENI